MFFPKQIAVTVLFQNEKIASGLNFLLLIFILAINSLKYISLIDLHEQLWIHPLLNK